MILEAWKGALEIKGLRVNVQKTKMMISSENAGKVAKGTFPSHSRGLSKHIIKWPVSLNCGNILSWQKIGAGGDVVN